MCIYKNNNNILKFTSKVIHRNTVEILGLCTDSISLLASLLDEPSMYQRTSTI